MATPIRIFCDFDGTVAQEDVGDLLFSTFAPEAWNGPIREAIERWKRGELNSRYVLEQECRLTRITPEELIRFSDQQKLDPYFPEFAAYCQTRNIPVVILSDGLDFYIRRILSNYGLAHLEVRANRLIFLNGDRIAPEFPYWKHTCGLCGNCKGYHLRESRKEGERVVHIGDALSDRCAVREADLIFAKPELAEYCQQHGIPYIPFQSFKDVLEEIRLV